MSQIKVQIYKMHEDSTYPSYKNVGDAGMDITAYITDEFIKDKGHLKNPLHERSLWVRAGSRILIPTGIKVSIPQGYEIQVRPRSGLALKQGLTVLNSPGTIDSGYRGEIGVIILNTSTEDILINHGDRIAQLVLNEVPSIVWDIVEDEKNLGETIRGEGGFGSTGV